MLLSLLPLQFNIFSGFVITYPNIPNGWRWMNRFSPATWVLYGLGAAQLGNVQDPMEYNGQVRQRNHAEGN